MSAHLCDVNVWIALSLEQHALRQQAAEWLDSVYEPASLLFCRSTQQSFLRLLTTASIVARFGYTPLTNSQAWTTYEAFLADDRIVYRPDEPPGLQRLWRELATRPTPSPKLWMDAYLAAFAISAGLTFVTADSAFRQFPSLDLLLIE